MKIHEIAPVFHAKYCDALEAIAASRAVRIRAENAPKASEMLSAVQAVVDCGAEPRHYAWYATSFFSVPSPADPEARVVGVANAVSPRAFTPEAAAGFAHWYEVESARTRMAVKVATEDRIERLSAGMTRADWIEMECQEPVVKAESVLELVDTFGDRRLTPPMSAVVRAGEARLGYAPGYCMDDFPRLKRRIERGEADDMGRPLWM